MEGAASNSSATPNVVFQLPPTRPPCEESVAEAQIFEAVFV